MIEKLAGAVAEVGKTAAEGFEKAFDPDKRVDTQTEARTPDVSSKEIDFDKRQDSPNIKYDDNGKAYSDENGLRPNDQYELNGYKYETDSKGRTISAEGELYSKETPGHGNIKPTLEQIAKGDAKKGDDKGHIIANRFNGSGDIGNLTAQDASLNRGDIKALETQLAKEVTAGKEVFLRVDIIYPKNSNRPQKYGYTYKIDGVTYPTVFFKNKAA